jgi:archaellum component FlaC
VAASPTLEELSTKTQEAYNLASASMGRQDMLAGNLADVRDTVKRIEKAQEKTEAWQRKTETWQNITDNRLDHMEDSLLGIHGDIAKLNHKYDGISKRVGELNTKYERLDQKVDGLDKKVGLLTDDVGELKAGQVELRDMVATLLARSEGVDNRN